MMKKYFSICIALAVLLMCGCGEDDLIQSDLSAVEYLSFKSMGCHSSNKLAKTNMDTVIDWECKGDTLAVSVLFSTYCSALIKDSVNIVDNKIEICLADTSGRVVRCTCPQKEELTFKAVPPKKIEVIFYFKSAISDAYCEMCSSIIEL